MLDVASSEQIGTSTSYLPYPVNKPFLNTEWVRSQYTLSKAFPESNRDLIMNSLKKLQEKLNKLELNGKNNDNSKETIVAEHKLNEDSSNIYQAYPINNNTNNTHHDSDDFNDGYLNNLNNKGQVAGQQTNNIRSYIEPTNDYLNKIDEKSFNTEKRVLELEKQLEKMRKLLNEDSEKNATYNLNSNPNTNKTNELSKNELRKSYNRSNGESDTTLYDAEYGFYNDQGSTDSAELQEDQCTRRSPKRSKKSKAKNGPNRQFQQPHGPIETNEKQFTKSLTTCRSRSEDTLSRSNNGAQNHYRLNLGDIPFVVGKSTAPSHRLGSNIQNVISLLKMHHPKLCNSMQNGCRSQSTQSIRNSSMTQNLNCNMNNNASLSTKKSSKKLRQTKSFKIPRSNSITQHQDSVSQPKQANLEKTNRNINNNNNNGRNDSGCESYDSSIGKLEWNELLRVLQEEYTKLVLQHYDVTKKIINCNDSNQRNEYENQADHLHKKMRTKAKQINKLKSYQSQHKKLNKKADQVNENDSSNQLHNQKRVKNSQNSTSLRSSRSFSDHLNNHANNTSHHQEHLIKTSSTVYHPVPLNHSKTLKLFKDIKNLQSIIQSDVF